MVVNFLILQYRNYANLYLNNTAVPAPEPVALSFHDPVAVGFLFCNRLSKYIQPENEPAGIAAFDSGLPPGYLNPIR